MTQLEKQSRVLERHLSVALAKSEFDVPANAVHRLRTTARRLQTLLDFCAVKLPGKERHAVRELEKVRKRAGKVRDLDVQLALLRRPGNRSAALDRQALRQMLLRKRNKKAERLAAAAREVVQSKFADHLHAGLQKALVSSGSFPDEPNPLLQARLKLKRLGEEFAAQANDDSEQLHSLRIDLKKVRYLAELAPVSDATTQFIEELKSVQSVLGEWRDWELLAKTAEKHFADRTSCAFLAEIRAHLAVKQAMVIPTLTRLLAARVDKKQPHAVRTRRAFAQQA